MIHRAYFILLVLPIWSLIPCATQEYDPQTLFPSVESRDVAPLALKYRQEVCRLIEATCHMSISLEVEPMREMIGPHRLLEFALQPQCDPCYRFMSMQL